MHNHDRSSRTTHQNALHSHLALLWAVVIVESGVRTSPLRDAKHVSCAGHLRAYRLPRIERSQE